MGGNNVQQKTKNNNGNIGISFGPSRLTLLNVYALPNVIKRMISNAAVLSMAVAYSKRQLTQLSLGFCVGPVILLC